VFNGAVNHDRRRRVLELVQENGRVPLADLASELGVSEMTVRRDLDALAHEGLVRRVRGAAVSTLSPGPLQRSDDRFGHPAHGSSPYAHADQRAGELRSVDGQSEARSSRWPALVPDDRRVSPMPGTLPSPVPASPPGPLPGGRSDGGHPGEASSVSRPAAEVALDNAARAVARTLPEGATVLLDAGPAAAALARQLRDHPGLTVAVLGLQAAAQLADAPRVRVLVVGGQTRPGEDALVGPLALTALGSLAFDTVVLSPDAVHPVFGWSTSSPEHAELQQAGLATADRALAILTPQALGRRSLVHLAPIDAVSQLVVATTSPAPQATNQTVQDLRATGLEVLLA
jgi:DeoR/GlpR family transcriptional regulator of sugar metabolism